MWAMDIETTGLNPFEAGFQIKSLAAHNSEGEYYIEGHEECLEWVRVRPNDTMLLYNAGYELNVFNRFDVAIPKWIDCMRLVRLHGHARDGESISLKETSAKFLREKFFEYEREIKLWCIANGAPAAKWGSLIHKAPREMLKEYNLNDVRATWELFHLFADRLPNWEQDHEFYRPFVLQVVKTFQVGIAVEPAVFRENLAAMEALMQEKHAEFLDINSAGIAMLLKMRRQVEEADYLARRKRPPTPAELEKHLSKFEEFNPNSDRQLAELFCGVYGVSDYPKTEKGSPSFSTKEPLQHYYGEKIKPLVELGSIGTMIGQVKAILERTVPNPSGGWLIRPEFNLSCTTTGRLRGSGGVNFQGLARRDARVMAPFVARQGHVFVSTDLGSAEPTVICELTQDPIYRAFVFDYKDKPAEYIGEILYCSDIYLSVGSVCAATRDPIRRAFESGAFADIEVAKKLLKRERALCKAAVLGLGYGIGAQSMQLTLASKGFEVSLRECQDFKAKYWKLFALVDKYRTQCALRVKRDGYIENCFYFRMQPKEKDAFNAEIQSTVNGLMAYLIQFMLDRGWHICLLIHDEIIAEVPKSKLTQYRADLEEGTAELNRFLGWSVPVTTGFVIGSNLYEAK